MKRAIGLIRVSTEDQKETGYGIPEQVERISAYIASSGYNLVDSVGFATDGIDYLPGFFQEDFTGKTPLRPAVYALRNAIEQHKIDVVVIHRTNRLGRKGFVQRILEADFQARGVKVEYVTAQFDTENHYGRFIRNVMSDIDELEYESTINQLKSGKEQAVKQGSIMVVQPPYGYDLIKARREDGKKVARLEINEGEAAIVRDIFTWYVYGDEDGKPLTIIAIVNKLTAMGIPTRWDTGRTKHGSIGLHRKTQPACVWTLSTVFVMLQAETYIGRWAYGKSKRVPIAESDKSKIVPVPKSQWLWVDIPSIIERELFEAAQEKMKENRRLSKKHKKYTYLFSGMLKCSVCMRAYCGDCATVSIPYYRCRGQRVHKSVRCTMPNFREDEIDAVVWPWIKEIVKNPDKVQEALDERQREAQERNKHIIDLITSVDRLINEMTQEQERVLTLYKKGKLDADRWEAEDKQYQKQLSNAKTQRTELEGKLSKVTYDPEYFQDVRVVCSYIAEGIEHFTHEEKREIYELLCLTGILAIEEGAKVIYAECILDARRLAMKGSIDFSSCP